MADDYDDEDYAIGGWVQEIQNLTEAYLQARERGNLALQEDLEQQIEQLAAQHTEEESSWVIAMRKAHEHEAEFDWEAAEEAYLSAVENAAGEPPLQSLAYRQIADLRSLLGDDLSALEAVKQALACAGGQDMPIWAFMAAADKARLGLHLGNSKATRLAPWRRGATWLKGAGISLGCGTWKGHISTTCSRKLSIPSAKHWTQRGRGRKPNRRSRRAELSGNGLGWARWAKQPRAA